MKHFDFQWCGRCLQRHSSHAFLIGRYSPLGTHPPFPLCGRPRQTPGRRIRAGRPCSRRGLGDRPVGHPAARPGGRLAGCPAGPGALRRAAGPARWPSRGTCPSPTSWPASRPSLRPTRRHPPARAVQDATVARSPGSTANIEPLATPTHGLWAALYVQVRREDW